MKVYTSEEYRKEFFPRIGYRTLIRRLHKKQIPTHHTVIKKGRDFTIIIDDDIRVKRGLPFKTIIDPR